jgi:uncharacterized phiE125 gp8 family phage protein
MHIRVKTAPTVEPVTLYEAKTHCRLDYEESEENSLIETLITAARQQVEALTNRALITQTLQLVLDAWPDGAIELPRPPVVTVTSVTYADYLGVPATLSAATDYYLDDESEPALVALRHGKSWPRIALRSSGAIVVEYTAGYGATAASVPRSIVQAMLLLIGYWYENREAMADSKFAVGLRETPFAVSALLAPYVVRTF